MLESPTIFAMTGIPSLSQPETAVVGRKVLGPAISAVVKGTGAAPLSAEKVPILRPTTHDR